MFPCSSAPSCCYFGIGHTFWHSSVSNGCFTVAWETCSWHRAGWTEALGRDRWLETVASLQALACRSKTLPNSVVVHLYQLNGDLTGLAVRINTWKIVKQFDSIIKGGHLRVISLKTVIEINGNLCQFPGKDFAVIKFMYWTLDQLVHDLLPVRLRERQISFFLFFFCLKLQVFYCLYTFQLKMELLGLH